MKYILATAIFVILMTESSFSCKPAQRRVETTYQYFKDGKMVATTVGDHDADHQAPPPPAITHEAHNHVHHHRHNHNHTHNYEIFTDGSMTKTSSTRSTTVTRPDFIDEETEKRREAEAEDEANAHVEDRNIESNIEKSIEQI